MILMTHTVGAWVGEELTDRTDFVNLCLAEHFAAHDYGCCEQDAEQNLLSLRAYARGEPGRVMTVHKWSGKETVWVITEWSEPADRHTTVLFPEDY